ncbi:hypothetical protein Cs308_0843 [Candidatus Chlamydia sanziniae]|uniref:Uncharacterized protein n=1 Tax=Candidatus Chlamydia sanziniae TaxID=1806891 RepID=A0A1A9HY48_9CHLA|nr:hypothetical protein Cs308_0843 [Candidatus Chlamydia sanziniae]
MKLVSVQKNLVYALAKCIEGFMSCLKFWLKEQIIIEKSL